MSSSHNHCFEKSFYLWLLEVDKSSDLVCIFFWINKNFNHSELSLISFNYSQNLQCAREPGHETGKAGNVMVFQGRTIYLNFLAKNHHALILYCLLVWHPLQNLKVMVWPQTKASIFPLNQTVQLSQPIRYLLICLSHKGQLAQGSKQARVCSLMFRRGLGLWHLGFWGCVFYNSALWVVCHRSGVALLSAGGGWKCMVWMRTASLLLAAAVTVGSAVSSLCTPNTWSQSGLCCTFPTVLPEQILLRGLLLFSRIC